MYYVSVRGVYSWLFVAVQHPFELSRETNWLLNSSSDDEFLKPSEWKRCAEQRSQEY